MARRCLRAPTVTFLAALLLLAGAFPARGAQAQGGQQTGTITGRVTSDDGAPLSGVQVFLEGTTIGTATGSNGEYQIVNVPAGTHLVRARLIGYRSQADSVTVAAGERATHDFTLVRDPLQLQAVVVTGTQTPRINLESSVAVTTLSPQEIDQAAPRSTTEMLRYVPGFTRVESSGGEVNQNITMRGILGVEYVMFMEDGLPVFPTMHTFFMNADNLFRPDENIERMEVVRGGSSALFGSNTPGAIINIINKTGGAQFGGTLKATAATEGLARYDFNLNGPLADDWRFNFGGFYRYDHGVRDPGFPGIRGGQVKGNVTRLLDNGYLRASVKYIDDRNQFILPLPFQNPEDPRYVPGFSDYGAMTSIEGNHIRVPTPTGELELPLDDGLRTRATWLTADASFDLGEGWHIQNAAQVMQNDQGWNAIVPSDVMPASEFITRPTNQNGLGLPAGTQFQFVYTNHPDATGKPTPFDTPNGLVAPGGQWHVEKPISAFQNQLQLQKIIGRQTLSFGVYFANYTQDNHWFFTDILTDVRDNPRFLDLLVFNGPDTINVTKNGFRRYISNYVNGSGQATIVSGVVGGAFELTDRLRADAGVRWEWDNFVQSAENTADVDLDGNPATTFDVGPWGNNSFRHFDRSLDDWAASLDLNYTLTDNLSVYAQGGRAYKMPALDEFLNAASDEQVRLFDSREVRNVEGGVKFASSRVGFTVNGFYTQLKNITEQGAVTDPATGRTTWIIQINPENKSYGVELEASGSPVEGLNLLASGTFLKAELATCDTTTNAAGRRSCPPGAEVGSLILGVPNFIGNGAAAYTFAGLTVRGDVHFVGRRFASFALPGQSRSKLPAYAYANFSASYAIPGQGLTLTADVLNAFQSKGLEEGNPRLTLVGGRTSDLFLARPILPRRFLFSLQYDF